LLTFINGIDLPLKENVKTSIDEINGMYKPISKKKKKEKGNK